MKALFVSVIDEVRDIVVATARQKQTITYGQLCKRVTGAKLLPNGRALAEHLTAISEMEHNAGRPLLSVIVVNAKTGMPSPPFFKRAAKILGRSINLSQTFFEQEKSEVFRAWGPPRDFFPHGPQR